MSTGLWWIFDLLVILIGGYVIYSNGKRGISKVLILGIGYILTTLLASVLAAVAAPTLYDSVAYRTNISGIESVDEHMDFVKMFTSAMEEKKYGFQVDEKKVREYLTNEDNLNFDSNLYHYANRMSGTPVSTKAEFLEMIREAFIAGYGKQLGERLPRYVKMNFEQQVRENPQLMRQLVANFYNNSLSAEKKADVTEAAFAKEPTTEVLRIFIYFILFSVLMVIIALISSATQKNVFFNIQKGTDHFVGGLLGILEAGVMIVLLTLLVRLIVLLCGGEFLFFNEETIGASRIFSFFYSNISRLL